VIGNFVPITQKSSCCEYADFLHLIIELYSSLCYHVFGKKY
jgi:hypothetical protein